MKPGDGTPGDGGLLPMKRTLLILACVAFGGLGTYLGTSLLQGQGPAAAPIPKELTSYRDIVKRVLPAVVSIEALNTPGGAAPRRAAPDMQLPDAPRFDSPRGEETPDRVGFGSGFFISPRGVVVTNNHVVEGADTAVVRLKDGRSFTSTKVFRDPKTD